jgi:hypothetical protein
MNSKQIARFQQTTLIGLAQWNNKDYEKIKFKQLQKSTKERVGRRGKKYYKQAK